LQKKKRSRLKKLAIWLTLDVVVAVTIVGLLFYNPSSYNPAPPAPPNPDGEPVHRYISHELAPTLYNGAQDRRPFEMVIRADRLNEAIAGMQWPKHAEGLTLSAPAVLFRPGRVVLMATANIESANLVVTVEVVPEFNDRNYLNLKVAKVKIGAMNVTPLARTLARRKYQERLEMGPVDSQDIRTKIAASLLAQESFDPVFRIDDKWVRLQAVRIAEGELIGQLVPAR